MSRVIHIRGIDMESMADDLLAHCSQFGTVTSVCSLARRQALVEFETVEAADAMMQTDTFTIQGKELHVAYSRSQRIVTPGGRAPAPNRVLLLKIFNPIFPVTVDTLHTIFSPFGDLLRAVIFFKTNLQALVEFGSLESAQMAKHQLDGKDIYTGCCTLKIEFSRVEKLNVQENSDRTRDFTNPNLPTGTSPGPSRSRLSNLSGSLGSNFHHSLGSVSGGLGGSSETGGRCVLMVYNVDPEFCTPDCLFKLFSLYGNVSKIKVLRNKKGTAMVQMQDGAAVEIAITHLTETPLRGQKLQLQRSKQAYIADLPDRDEGSGVECTCRDYSNSSHNRFRSLNSPRHIYFPSNTLHFSNAPPQVDEEALLGMLAATKAPPPTQVRFFARRVQAQRDRRMGLLEFVSVESAVEALCCANNTLLMGQPIRLAFSQNNINPPSESTERSNS